MFPEYPPDVSDDAKEAMAWAAYSDADAFWPLEDDLVQMMHDAGFARSRRSTSPATATCRGGVSTR